MRKWLAGRRIVELIYGAHYEDGRCLGCRAVEGARCSRFCPRMWVDRLVHPPPKRECPFCTKLHRYDASSRTVRCPLVGLVSPGKGRR